MSRRSAQKKKTMLETLVGEEDAADQPEAIVEEEAQPAPQDNVVVAVEPPAPAAVPAAAPKKKAKAKKAAPTPAAAEEEGEQEKTEKPKKGKRAHASDKDEGDEEAEAAPSKEKEKDEQEEAAPSASKKKKEKKEKKEKRVIKRSEAGRAQGSRFESVKSYRGQLKKHREKKEEKEGSEAKVHRKAKPGAAAKREVKFLSRANGLYLGTALVRRMVGESIKNALPIVRAENERTARRLEARGKPVPANLTVAEKWSVSPGVVQLIRGAAQESLSQVADLGTTLRTHTGRETILERDIAVAREILRSRRA